MKRLSFFMILFLSVLSLHAADDKSKMVMPFERYFHVDYIPFDDPNIADVIFWKVDTSTGHFSKSGAPILALNRIVGAREFIDVLKKRQPDYREAIKTVVQAAAQQYVSDENTDVTYD